MKKLISILLACTLVLCVCSGCLEEGTAQTSDIEQQVPTMSMF